MCSKVETKAFGVHGANRERGKRGSCSFLFRASRETFRASVFSRDKQSVAACNFSGVGVTPFLTDKGGWGFERWHSGPRGVGNFNIQVPHRAWRSTGEELKNVLFPSSTQPVSSTGKTWCFLCSPGILRAVRAGFTSQPEMLPGLKSSSLFISASSTAVP